MLRYQEMALPFVITVLRLLTALFWKQSLASSDMASKIMSQYIWLHLHVFKIINIKIISHSFPLISRCGNNRMFHSYCHIDCGLTFMFCGLNDTVLFYGRNSVVLSFRS
jgi:hypothetical protein